MTDIIFGKEYIVKVTDDGECVTARELIRCKDCMYHEDKEISEYGLCCLIGCVGWEDNDYCSKADRKDNGKTN